MNSEKTEANPQAPREGRRVWPGCVVRWLVMGLIVYAVSSVWHEIKPGPYSQSTYRAWCTAVNEGLPREGRTARLLWKHDNLVVMSGKEGMTPKEYGDFYGPHFLRSFPDRERIMIRVKDPDGRTLYWCYWRWLEGEPERMFEEGKGL